MDVDSHQEEESVKGGQDLLGDVVVGVEAQGAVQEDLPRLPDQLDQGQARCAVHHQVGHPLTHTRLATTVIRKTLPERR